MALTLKNPQVEALAEEVANLAGESKTEAIRRALLDRRDRIRVAGSKPKLDLERFLKTHIWPAIPAEKLGREVTKDELEEYLGFGPGGA